MLVLIGKASSGKDTVKNSLIEKYGFHGIITYTTRPKRKGEIDGVNYHYISQEEFLEKVNNGFFAEWKKYLVGEDIWYYGSALEDILDADSKTVIILTPDGVRDIKKFDIDVYIVYIYANLATIEERLRIRKDKNDKAVERIQRDLRDFKDAETLANVIIYNNSNNNIDEVVAYATSKYEENKWRV